MWAWGAAVGLRLLRMQGGTRRLAHVAGDCPAVVRWCAGAARLRDASIRVALGAGLADTTASGWRVEWTVVPRRANVDAHTLAVAPARRADRLPGGGKVWRVRAGRAWAGSPLTNVATTGAPW